jgi:uncharacterized membrane protein YeaQ/YmgE (transglycosylase-associated protein family)
MTLYDIILLAAIGILAGWLAGLIWKGRGFGVLGNLVIGVIGSFLGSYLAGVFGLRVHTMIGTIIAAVAGAFILLLLVNIIRRK